MQVPIRPLGSYGYSMRNYAAAPLLPVPSSKPSGGRKSFTIDALLAEPEDSSPDRAEDHQRYPPLMLLPPPLRGGSAALAPYVFQPAALHGHAGYTSYCCWPPSCQPTTCRAAIYSQGTKPVLGEEGNRKQNGGKQRYSKQSLFFLSTAPSTSRVHAGSLNPFKAKGGKSKRMRTSFTSEQLSRLEKEFARQQYMVGSERFLLASALQLTEAQVRTHTGARAFNAVVIMLL